MVKGKIFPHHPIKLLLRYHLERKCGIKILHHRIIGSL